jgi:hypothetical protein
MQSAKARCKSLSTDKTVRGYVPLPTAEDVTALRPVEGLANAGQVFGHGPVGRVAGCEVTVWGRAADALVVRAAVNGAADGPLLAIYLKGEEHGQCKAPAVQPRHSIGGCRMTSTVFAHPASVARLRRGRWLCAVGR